MTEKEVYSEELQQPDRELTETTLDIDRSSGYANADFKDDERGLKAGEYVDIEKYRVDGQQYKGEYGPYYRVTVLVDGEQVSGFLNEKEHEQYAKTGGEGDKVRMSRRWIQNSRGQAFQRLQFELLE
jgi:hypothetical protein